MKVQKVLLGLVVVLIIMSLIYIVYTPYNIGSYLPLVVGIAIGITVFLHNKVNKNKIESILYKLLLIGFVYFIITFTIFTVITISNRKIESNQDYDAIIVLGAGLKNGVDISPTLKMRLNKALELYEKKDVVIVVSGGRGKDELVTEASAMKKYLVECGIDENKIYTEDKSTSTYENFKFSKEVLDSIFDDDYKIVFTSNDYHIFRSEKYMSENEIKGYGVGTRSPFARIPSDYLREYLATHAYYFKYILRKGGDLL